MLDDELSEIAVRSELTSVWLGRPYLYVPEIGSTNDRLKTRAADPAYPAGTVLLADYQSAGRGRLERRWEAPPGTSLLFSALFRPRWPARQGTWLTMLAGLAVVEAIESATGLRAGLKWPNDVVLPEEMGEAQEWRKVCGLLLEATLDPNGRMASAVLGVGLNVNIPADSLPDSVTPATSLLVAGGRPVSRRKLLVGLLERIERHYDAALDGRSPARAWAARLITIGRPVEATSVGSSAPLVGTAEGVDEWGQLLVRDDEGILHTIAAGDVTLRGR